MAGPGERQDLSRFALLSIAVSIVVIGLKVWAWQVSGSVGLLSDAAESVVNLVAAVAAFVALRVVARPADSGHNFGHAKAEYFSAVLEGVMIIVAAGAIIFVSVERLLNPRELEAVGLGLVIAVVASLLNGAVAVILLRAGRAHRSLTLEADGKHLMTDVWTTAGVIVGVALVAVTGWVVLDSLVAIAVAINILFVGFHLVRRSGSGLMDAALSAADRDRIDATLAEFDDRGVTFHDIRTRESGHQRFVQMHMLVPGDWTIQRAHDLTEEVEQRLAHRLDDLHIIIHVEPLGDPRSYESWRLD